MFENPMVERFLDPNCSDEELDDLRAWLEYHMCPSCSSKDIAVVFESVLDQEQYFVGEIVDCHCLNVNCQRSELIERNLD